MIIAVFIATMLIGIGIGLPIAMALLLTDIITDKAKPLALPTPSNFYLTLLPCWPCPSLCWPARS